MVNRDRSAQTPGIPAIHVAELTHLTDVPVQVEVL